MSYTHKTFTEIEVDAALCLYDHACDLLHASNKTPLAILVRKQQEDYGIATIRQWCIRWAKDCESVWLKLPEDIRDRVAFDFEYCPMYFRLIWDVENRCRKELVKIMIRELSSL